MGTFTFRIDEILLQAAHDCAVAHHTTITQLLIDGLIVELERRNRILPGGTGGHAGRTTTPPGGGGSAGGTVSVFSIEPDT